MAGKPAILVNTLPWLYVRPFQAERELLIKERRARQEAEREKEELMQRLKQYEREAKDANDALVCCNELWD